MTEKPAAACTIIDTPYRGFDRWIDISIEGPTREAVAAAIEEYTAQHRACEPSPVFILPVQNPAPGVFGVNGSRGLNQRL